MKKNILCIAAAAISLLACSKSDPMNPGDGELRFNVSYPSTKATATAFEDGDSFSLYAVEYDGEEKMPLQVGGNYLNNEKITLSGTAWTPARTLYWSSKPCDFYAVYPYQASIGSVEKYQFSVAADQSGDGYEASDLLYACSENVSREAGAVPLHFQHIMSKMVVNVLKGEKFEGKIPDDITAHIYNTNVECTANLVKGSVEKNAFGAKNTITMKKISNERFEAILVPQNLERSTPLVELTMGGIAYLLDYSLSFRAGYVHTINVTLNTSPDQEQIEISIDPSADTWK